MFGSVSEQLDEIISNYVNKNNKKLRDSYVASPEERLPSENFMNMCYYRALRSLAEPGETVGLLAAQVNLKKYYIIRDIILLCNNF